MVKVQTLGTIALLGLVGFGAVMAYKGISDLGKSISDALNAPAKFIGELVSGAGFYQTPYPQSQVGSTAPINSPVAQARQPYSPSTIGTSIPTLLQTALNKEIPKATSGGSSYGATIFQNGLAYAPTAASGKAFATKTLLGKTTPQQQAAVALGVPSSWINPNINKFVASSTSSQKMSIAPYLTQNKVSAAQNYLMGRR